MGHMLMPSAQRWADNQCCRCMTSCPDYKTPIRHQLAAIALISSAKTWEYVVWSAVYCWLVLFTWQYTTWEYTQGLTQTFMSSGPQDHQLRGSGGPTIFLVVLTTTNVITLGNLEPIFLIFAIMCFHIVNFVKPQKAWQETIQGDDRSQCKKFLTLMIRNTCFVPSKRWEMIQCF